MHRSIWREAFPEKGIASSVVGPDLRGLGSRRGSSRSIVSTEGNWHRKVSRGQTIQSFTGHIQHLKFP